VEAEFLGQLKLLERRCLPGVKLAGRVLNLGNVTDLGSQRELASRAARHAAAQLVHGRGIDAWLPDSKPSGVPSFPHGLVGSLAHDCQVAVAAIAPRDEAAAIGIDVEPAIGLPAECLQTVASQPERASLSHLVEARLLFCAKEAVFKAVSSSGGPWLEHCDVEVDLCSETAVARGHLRLSLRVSRWPRLLAVAILAPKPIDPPAELFQNYGGGLHG
jgi:4'-phosphopantetheinyl transferase EntD